MAIGDIDMNGGDSDLAWLGSEGDRPVARADMEAVLGRRSLERELAELPPRDQILYIDEIPRPSEPWYVILNKIVPHLLIEPFQTRRCSS